MTPHPVQDDNQDDKNDETFQIFLIDGLSFRSKNAELNPPQKAPVSLDDSGSRKRERPFHGLSAPLSPSSETSLAPSSEGTILSTGKFLSSPFLHRSPFNIHNS